MVTFVIIVTFAFFGTSQAISSGGKKDDPVVFKTEQGEKVRKSLLDQTTLFLSSEQSGFPSPWSLFSDNYLNDGIISKEFLHAGVEKKVVEYDALLTKKWEKERNFKPFVHAQARALSADSCWTLFAPDIKEKLAALQKGDRSFETRATLFESERRFPPALLAQMLRYQEQEYSNMGGDPRLFRGEVSLFGYHNLEDWFGSEYIEECAKVVLNGASLARKKGYVVKRDEVYSEILARTHAVYEGYRREISDHIPNAQAFYQTFIRQNGYDEQTLVKIVESVLLFRRLLDDVSHAPLVDTLAIENFHQFAGEYATLEVTQMPTDLRFKDVEQWKRFEGYLEAVAPQSDLGLPTAMDPIEVIEKRAPELVGERYALYVGRLEKRALEAKVSMRETWEWEEQNLALLQERFPQLKQESLDSFDAKKRSKIDAFAREQIVEMHPEWIVFDDVDMKEVELFLTSVTKKHDALPGVTNFAALVKEDEIAGYSEDNKNFYRVLVKSRPETKEVLPLSQCKREGDVEKRRAQIEKYVGTKLTLEEAMPHRFSYFFAEQESSLFEPVTREVTVSRIEPSFIVMDELVEEGYSPVCVDEKEGAYYYKLLDKRVDHMVPTAKVQQAQELLAQELRQDLLKKLINA